MYAQEKRASIAADSHSQFDYSAKFFPEPDPQQRLFEDERTAALVLKAAEWADTHKAQFLHLAATIAREHRLTGKPQSIRNTSVRLCCSHPHDLDAALGRLMLMRFPEMEGSIRLSKSKVDGYEWVDIYE